MPRSTPIELFLKAIFHGGTLSQNDNSNRNGAIFRQIDRDWNVSSPKKCFAAKGHSKRVLQRSGLATSHKSSLGLLWENGRYLFRLVIWYSTAVITGWEAIHLSQEVRVTVYDTCHFMFEDWGNEVEWAVAAEKRKVELQVVGRAWESSMLTYSGCERRSFGSCVFLAEVTVVSVSALPDNRK